MRVTGEATRVRPAVDGSRSRGSRARLGALFVLFVMVALLIRGPGLSNRVFNSDEAYIATQAQALVRGERLYVDAVDRKPPIVPYLYAGVFETTGSDDLGPVRALAALAAAITATLIAVEAERRFAWRRAGLVGGLLYLSAAAAFRPLDAQAANFEVFAAPIVTAAMLLAIRRRIVAGGLVAGLATLTLQTAGLVLVPMGWLAWRSGRSRALFVLTAAFVTPIVLAALVFGWDPFVRWVFTSNGGYLSGSGDVVYALRLGVSQSGWFVLGSAALVALLPFAWRYRHDDVELWLWLGSSCIGIVAGLRFFGHYYLQLGPPLTLLGVRALGSPLLRARRWVLIAVITAASVSTAGFLALAWTGHATKDTRIALAVGGYLAAHTHRDQRVLVWGQAPETYWSSRRRPAVRFETTGFLTGATGGRPPARVGEQDAVAGAWTDFLSDLRAHPPVLIADMSTANQRHSSLTPPSSYPQFSEYLRRGGWMRIATVDGVAILRRTRT